MSKLTKALTAAAGNAGGTLGYVEDVFSTYLYIGNSANQNIVNGIDLAGEGGMVWTKRRDNSQLHGLFDTERGVLKYISSDRTDAETTRSNTLKAFNSDGFQLGYESFPTSNSNGEKGVSWTFRKAEKFFDVVTYTGNGSTTYAHSLNAIPAFVLYKATSTTSSWLACTRKNDGSYVVNILNGTTGTIFSYADADAMGLTETTFNPNPTGASSVGTEYVAYLFASDAGGFGDDGSENIIKCGSYTGNGSVDGTEVDCGFEPQFLLLKAASTTGNWLIYDNMRGFVTGGTDSYLQPNTSNAEGLFESGEFLPNGFKLKTTDSVLNGSGSTYIYIAIRRPMKTPESGTEVFAIDTAVDYSTNPSGKSFDSGFPVDMFLNKEVDQSYNNALYSRLTNKGLRTNTTDSEFNMGGTNWDSNIAVYQSGSTNTNNYGWMFKRATGFFDVVAYTGDGVAGHTLNHNLGVVPELMIVKRRSATEGWQVYHKDLDVDEFLEFDTGSVKTATGNFSRWNNTRPTDSVFTVGGTWDAINASGSTYINYLFASVAGVSKVGSYTGTGADLNVDCGFSAGARFVLIKRTDSTGDWYVWDSVRGIVAGNDPYLLLNSTAAEVTSTDYIDPLSSGFTVTSSAPAALNASGGTYIYLSIA
jgi:hypothetical protein